MHKRFLDYFDSFINLFELFFSTPIPFVHIKGFMLVIIPDTFCLMMITWFLEITFIPPKYVCVYVCVCVCVCPPPRP